MSAGTSTRTSDTEASHILSLVRIKPDRHWPAVCQIRGGGGAHQNKIKVLNSLIDCCLCLWLNYNFIQYYFWKGRVFSLLSKPVHTNTDSFVPKWNFPSGIIPAGPFNKYTNTQIKINATLKASATHCSAGWPFCSVNSNHFSNSVIYFQFSRCVI